MNDIKIQSLDIKNFEHFIFLSKEEFEETIIKVVKNVKNIFDENEIIDGILNEYKYKVEQFCLKKDLIELEVITLVQKIIITKVEKKKKKKKRKKLVNKT